MSGIPNFFSPKRLLILVLGYFLISALVFVGVIFVMTGYWPIGLLFFALGWFILLCHEKWVSQGPYRRRFGPIR